MGDPYKGRLAGHALVSMFFKYACGDSRYEERAICECNEVSDVGLTYQQKREWHRQHKADVLDLWVANGCDDKGREIHL